MFVFANMLHTLLPGSSVSRNWLQLDKSSSERAVFTLQAHCSIAFCFTSAMLCRQWQRLFKSAIIEWPIDCPVLHKADPSIHALVLKALINMAMALNMTPHFLGHIDYAADVPATGPAFVLMSFAIDKRIQHHTLTSTTSTAICLLIFHLPRQLKLFTMLLF